MLHNETYRDATGSTRGSTASMCLLNVVHELNNSLNSDSLKLYSVSEQPLQLVQFLTLRLLREETCDNYCKSITSNITFFHLTTA